MGSDQAQKVDQYFSLFEKAFSIFALVFYTVSIFFLIKFNYEIAATLEKLIYHAVTLLNLLLLLIYWRKLIPVLKGIWPLITLVSFVLASTFWSDAPGLSMQQYLPLIRCTLLGIYFGVRFDIEEALSIFSAAFIISGFLSLVFALVLPQYGVMGMGFILSGEDIKHAGSWRGVYSHKNYLGRSMVLGILCVFLTEVRKRLYLLKYFCLSVFALCLLLSDSKTSLVIFITMLALIPLLKSMRLEYSWMIPILTVSVLCSGSVVTVLFDNFDQLLNSLGKDATLSGRTDLWYEILLSVRDRPFLGHGYGAFWVEGGGAEIVWQEFGWQAPHAHNGLLDLLVDIGIVGTAIFLLSYVFICCRALLLLRKTNSLSGIFPIAFLIMMFMVNLTESSTVVRPQFAWTIFVGISILSQKELSQMAASTKTSKRRGLYNPEEAIA